MANFKSFHIICTLPTEEECRKKEVIRSLRSNWLLIVENFSHFYVTNLRSEPQRNDKKGYPNESFLHPLFYILLPALPLKQI